MPSPLAETGGRSPSPSTASRTASCRAAGSNEPHRSKILQAERSRALLASPPIGAGRRPPAAGKEGRMSDSRDLTGGCACGALRYRLAGTPLVVHACHCRDCQRITGSAFVVNVWIEGELVERLAGRPRSFALKGGGGKPHEVFFCGECGTTVW